MKRSVAASVAKVNGKSIDTELQKHFQAILQSVFGLEKWPPTARTFFQAVRVLQWLFLFQKFHLFNGISHSSYRTPRKKARLRRSFFRGEEFRNGGFLPLPSDFIDAENLVELFL